jgi:uncharacterized protein YdeI (YjbR/CyaY-like superfamily)
MNPKVDSYLNKAKAWQPEMRKLRSILLASPLTEELKWGKPCYTFQDSNVVLMIGFKNYCALMFAKGSLLKDPKRILIQPTENTQATRQLRFTNTAEIDDLAPTIKTYITEAIEVQKAGLQIPYKKTSDFKVPAEFRTALNKNSRLNTAFKSLTPGRQRAYLLYFGGAKQSQTRESRIKKCTPQILKGKGLDD